MHVEILASRPPGGRRFRPWRKSLQKSVISTMFRAWAAWAALTGWPRSKSQNRRLCSRDFSMHIIDSHFHWWPRSIFDKLCKRQDYPRAAVNRQGGYDYSRRASSGAHLNSWAEWFDLDKQFEYMDSLGHRVDVVCSIGPFSVSFSDMPVEEGRDYALMWNEEMAGAQKKYPGRLWASAAVPLQDARVAIEVVDDAVNRLGLMGVNLPGSVGEDARIDAERLMPFYAHCEKLGLPLFLHPTDVIFQDI
ncbi:MAG: hypothetical protein E6G86_18595, partial [Alphaproteobacteria bacterium]